MHTRYTVHHTVCISCFQMRPLLFLSIPIQLSAMLRNSKHGKYSWILPLMILFVYFGHPSGVNIFIWLLFEVLCWGPANNKSAVKKSNLIKTYNYCCVYVLFYHNVYSAVVSMEFVVAMSFYSLFTQFSKWTQLFSFQHSAHPQHKLIYFVYRWNENRKENFFCAERNWASQRYTVETKVEENTEFEITMEKTIYEFFFVDFLVVCEKKHKVTILLRLIKWNSLCQGNLHGRNLKSMYLPKRKLNICLS